MGVGGVNSAIFLGHLDVPGEEALPRQRVDFPAFAGDIKAQDGVRLVAVYPDHAALAVHIQGVGYFVHYREFELAEFFAARVVFDQQGVLEGDDPQVAVGVDSQSPRAVIGKFHHGDFLCLWINPRQVVGIEARDPHAAIGCHINAVGHG